MPLEIGFWGTRGSIPTPGPATARYGGNTPCLSLADENGMVILDAGTGLRPLGRRLAARHPAGGLAVDLLLTHTHWDHIQGLPFFQPLFHPANRIGIFGPRQRGPALRDILRGQMDPAVFPVPLSSLRADLTVTEITPGDLRLPNFTVRAIDVCHPAPTLGYAIAPAGGGPSVIYMTDNELGGPDGAPRRANLVRFLRGGHTLVHDAMYFQAQARERVGWGHSGAAEAVELALEGGCRRLVLFHHDPDHDDGTLERLLAEAAETRDRWGGELLIALAAEGSTLRVEEEA